MAKYKRKARKSRKHTKKSLKDKLNGDVSYAMAKATSVNKIHRCLISKPYDFVIMSGRVASETLESSYVDWVGGSLNFSLNKITGSSNYTDLFDSYQICKVEVTFEPDIQEVDQLVGATTANAFTIPMLYVARDPDNTAVPTSESQLSQRMDCYRVQANKQFKISMVPQVGREIYRSSILTAYETPYETIWLDSVYSDVPHYGLTYGMTATGANNNNVKFVYKIRTKYWLRFKTVK